MPNIFTAQRMYKGLNAVAQAVNQRHGGVQPYNGVRRHRRKINDYKENAPRYDCGTGPLHPYTRVRPDCDRCTWAWSASNPTGQPFGLKYMHQLCYHWREVDHQERPPLSIVRG